MVEQNKMEQVTESTKSKQKIPLPAELIVLYIEQPKPKRKRRDDDDDDSSLADKDDNSGDAGSAGTGGIVTDSYGNLRPADGSSHSDKLKDVHHTSSSHADELKEAHRASSSHSDKLKEAHRASSSHSVELKDARHASSSRSDELQDARHSNTSYEHKDSQKVTLQNPKAARIPIAEKPGAEVQDVGIRNSNGGRESSSNDVGASAPKSGSSSTSNSTDELNKEKKEIKQNQTKGTGNGSSIVQKVDSSVAGLNTSGWSKQNNNHATAQASNGNSANNAQKPANNNTQSIKQATQSADQAKNQAKQGLSNNPQQWGYSMQGKSNGSGWSDAGAGRPSSSAQSVPTNTSRKGAERAERAEQQQQNKNVKPQKSHADMVRMDSNYSTGTPHEAGMNSAGRSETAQKIPHQNSSRNGAEKAESLDTVKPKTRAKILADTFTAPLRRQEGIMLTNGSPSENYTMLEGILGFEIKQESKKEITPQDYIYSNQRTDIDAPTKLFCVYTTEWNSYKNTYLVDTGKVLTKEQAVLARENALKDGAIDEYGTVLNYTNLAKSFNKTFGTNYGYEYTEAYVQKIPDDMIPTIQQDTAKKVVTLKFPHIRYKNSEYAHTTNYLGGQQVFDVWSGQQMDISTKGKVDKTTEGWDERYGEEGSYRIGYHTWYIYQ